MLSDIFRNQRDFPRQCRGHQTLRPILLSANLSRSTIQKYIHRHWRCRHRLVRRVHLPLFFHLCTPGIFLGQDDPQRKVHQRELCGLLWHLAAGHSHQYRHTGAANSLPLEFADAES